MRLHDRQLILAASDLAKHLACAHCSELDRAAAHGLLAAPRGPDPALEALIERGFAHERAYVESLHTSGLVVETCPENVMDAAGATLTAMRGGADVIVQAVLEHDGWYGRADILRRLARPSALGSWSYEVMDTKLTRE